MAIDSAAQRLEEIRARIAQAQRRFGPPAAAAVTLVAVSKKTFPATPFVPS